MQQLFNCSTKEIFQIGNCIQVFMKYIFMGDIDKILTQHHSGSPSIQEAAPMFVPIKESELLNKMTTNGLQVLYR